MLEISGVLGKKEDSLHFQISMIMPQDLVGIQDDNAVH